MRPETQRKFIYWTVGPGGEHLQRYCLIALAGLGLLCIVAQLMMHAGWLPRGWMP